MCDFAFLLLGKTFILNRMIKNVFLYTDVKER